MSQRTPVRRPAEIELARSDRTAVRSAVLSGPADRGLRAGKLCFRLCHTVRGICRRGRCHVVAAGGGASGGGRCVDRQSGDRLRRSGLSVRRQIPCCGVLAIGAAALISTRLVQTGATVVTTNHQIPLRLTTCPRER